MAVLSGAGAMAAVRQSIDYLKDENLRQIIFHKAYEAYHENDVFAALTGPPGSASPIHKYSTPGDGMSVRKGTTARFGQGAVMGDNRVKGTEESLRLGNYQFKLDYYRHSSSWTKKQRKSLIAGGTLEGLYAHYEGRWAQITKARSVMQRWRNSVTSLNFRTVGQSSFGAMVTANVLDRTRIIDLNADSRRYNISRVDIRNAVKTANGITSLTKGDMIISPIGALQNLKYDATMLDIEQSELQGGNGNSVILNGGYLKVDGTILNELPSMVDDAEASQSWPLEPIAYLGTNATGSSTLTPVVTPSDSSWTMYGTHSPDTDTPTPNYNFTNNTKVPHFEDFLGVSAIFGQEADQILATPSLFADSSSGEWFYICIYNHVSTGNSGGEAGKMGFYRYRASDVADNGNRIVFPANSRLSAATTTLGGLAYGSGPFAGKIATEHPVGARIFQVNRKGTAVVFNVYTGPGSMSVAMNEETSIKKEGDDADMVQVVTSQFVFGHEVAKNLQKQPYRYMVAASANPRPWGIPDYPVVT